jgi:hypothetical protein
LEVVAMDEAAKRKRLRCRLGLHRWTTRDHELFTCYRCEKQRTAGKTLRCRLGRHRWKMVRTGDGDAYRQCFFCRKQQSLHDFPLPLGGAGGPGI